MEADSLLDVACAVAPGVLYSSAQVAGVSGLAGVAFGGVVGTIRRTAPVLFATASGLQFTLLGGTYWATRQSVILYQAWKTGLTIHDATLEQKLVASAVGGAVAGGSAGLLFRGRYNVIPGAVVFSTVASIGQISQSYFSRVPTDPKNIQHEPGIMERIATSRFSPVKKLADDEYELMLKERLLRTEAEIALLDEQLSKMQPKERSSSEDRSNESG